MLTVLSPLIYGFEVMVKVLESSGIIAVTYKGLLVMAAVHIT